MNRKKSRKIPVLEVSAKEQGLVNCLSCASVHNLGDIAANNYRCPHCNAGISLRKRGGEQLVWIYLITSIILLFPANLLAISYTSFLGSAPQGDTIISSVFFLWHHGSYLIAVIIFIASIFTPIFKVFVLIYLLTHRHPQRPPLFATSLYRFIHFIGRWSMIDVFVVALLGALIHGRLANISPGAGIFAFAGVVVFTMLATEAFDIRILWDNYRQSLAHKEIQQSPKLINEGGNI